MLMFRSVGHQLELLKTMFMFKYIQTHTVDLPILSNISALLMAQWGFYRGKWPCKEQIRL